MLLLDCSSRLVLARIPSIMILVQRYQQRIAELPQPSAKGVTISITNVNAEQSDQDPYCMSQTRTATFTRTEHFDTDEAHGHRSTVYPR